MTLKSPDRLIRRGHAAKRYSFTEPVKVTTARADPENPMTLFLHDFSAV